MQGWGRALRKGGVTCRQLCLLDCNLGHAVGNFVTLYMTTEDWMHVVGVDNFKVRGSMGRNIWQATWSVEILALDNDWTV